MASKKKDVASVIEQARAALKEGDYRTDWAPTIKLLESVKTSIKSTDSATQVAYWTLLGDVCFIGDVRKLPEAARGLLACEPKAPANIRAVRMAKLAAAECRASTKAGHDTFQKALKLAPDDETRALVLLEWIGVEHDQVTPAVALLDIYELAKGGKLSDKTASAALERVAHAWPLATRAPSRKAQEKLLATRGIERNAMVLDACQRWLELNDKPSSEMVLVVGTLADQLFSAGRSKEALGLYAKWTPTFVKANKAGTIDDHTLRESWYSGQMTTLSLNGFEKEEKKIRKIYDSL